LTAKPLCTAKAKEKCNLTGNNRIVLHKSDIDITYMPKSWEDTIPLKGLRVQKLKCLIIDKISKNEETVETLRMVKFSV